MAYATTTELAAYLGDVIPDDAERLLDQASTLIDTHILAAYPTDANNDPTDTDDIAAFRDATCAQVEYWQAVGEDHDIEGIRGPVTIGGASWSLPQPLAPRAARHLIARALLTSPGGA